MGDNDVVLNGQQSDHPLIPAFLGNGQDSFFPGRAGIGEGAFPALYLNRARRGRGIAYQHSTDIFLARAFHSAKSQHFPLFQFKAYMVKCAEQA